MKKNTDKLNKFKPASESFEFQQYPFYWLMRVGSAYSMRMEKSLKKQGINLTAWRILMILREMGTLSVSEVATHAVAKTPTITRATYNLQEKELVLIRTSKNDGRVSIVELTEKGKTVIANIIENSQKLFDNIYDDFSADQIETFNSTLQKLFLNLDEA
ncbi:MarR family winged helix-turn-helix transcriptional regulator [Aliiglaciecola aliphaticivorans]